MASYSWKVRPRRLLATIACARSIWARPVMADLLEIEGLWAGYGEALVLSDIGFCVPDGQCLALLGRNGTGKTTLINSIVGLTTHKSGRIRLDGRDITRERPERRVAAGVGWSPQERNIFRSLSVEENLTAIA